MLEYVLSRGHLADAEARYWMRQLVSAVSHLHACDIVHLDIKLENVFVNTRNQLKIGDLGLAAIIPAGVLTHKVCGSGVYAAPEVLLGKVFGAYDPRAADVWSVGVCAFVMARGRFPFHVSHQTAGFGAYVEAQRTAREAGAAPAVPPPVLQTLAQRDRLSPSLLAFLDSCISFEPSHRPAVTQLATDAWMVGTQEAAAHPHDGLAALEPPLAPEAATSSPTAADVTTSAETDDSRPRTPSPTPPLKLHEAGAEQQRGSAAPDSPPSKRRRKAPDCLYTESAAPNGCKYVRRAGSRASGLPGALPV